MVLSQKKQNGNKRLHVIFQRTYIFKYIAKALQKREKKDERKSGL